MLRGEGDVDCSLRSLLCAEQVQKRVLGSVGAPIQGAEIAIVKDGAAVATGEEGTLAGGRLTIPPTITRCLIEVAWSGWGLQARSGPRGR
jgi:hypothetical protein